MARQMDIDKNIGILDESIKKTREKLAKLEAQKKALEERKEKEAMHEIYALLEEKNVSASAIAEFVRNNYHPEPVPESESEEEPAENSDNGEG